MLLLAGLTLYPVLYGVWLSLHHKHSFFPQQSWAGLENYWFLLADPEFSESVWRGVVYSVSTITLQIIIGVGAALALNQYFPGRSLVRGIVLFPYVIPTVVAVILWKWLLNNQFGLINYGMVMLGLTDEPINWMGRTYIMTSLILISVWQFFPFVVLAVLARLQTIPTELYEAARVDGAGPLSRFLYVTLPQLASVLFIVVLLRTIWMFTKFDTVWLMTQGGGAEKYIRTLPVYAYLRAFHYYEAGTGAAASVVMFLLLVVFAAVYFMMFRREEQL
ncbi:carbohydrate ABC transporter permease [Bradyrhizobium murdochi]|uniref:carbohydrate ABC transporter permease n=1 Tax=Bradyrhizobium murdochi TaxID=1038859 RepID=UPI0018DB134A|nr:sugar ABC transporter permease [Bradyrhizobium murdochi]